MSDLLERWCALASQWGAPSEDVAEIGRDVIGSHEEPHRRYHTAEHLREVLAIADELRDHARDSAAVELALWFHDAVYDPGAAATVNERASAERAVADLTRLGAPATLVHHVRQLVLATAGHEVADDDADGAVVIDADLSILGAAPERYRRYVRDVREEYRWLDDETWRAGRSALVRSFCARERLYRTDLAHTRFDGPARANLAWELSTLGG